MRRVLYLILGLLSPMVTAQAQDLGRLFFTSQERTALDAARKNKTQQAPKVEEPVIRPEAPTGPEMISLHGYLRRNDGRMTVWVNNKMAEGGETGSGLKVTRAGEHHGSLSVKLPDTPETIKLKVGQHLDATNGKVQESWTRAGADKSQTRAAARPSPAGPASEQGPLRESGAGSEQSR